MRIINKSAAIVFFAAVLLVGAQSDTYPQERGDVARVSNSSAQVWPNDAGIPAQFDLEQVFGGDTAEAVLLGDIDGVAVDRNGNVYVLDSQSPRLLSFGPDGRLLWSTGQRGEGPGDVSPGDLALRNPNTLYVIQDGGTQVDSWSTAGDYLGTQRLIELGISRAELAGFHPPSLLVLYRRPRIADLAGIEIIVIDIDSWQIVQEFAASVTDEPWPPRYSAMIGIDASVTSDLVWVGNSGSYSLRAYSLEGRLRHLVTVNAPYLRPPSVEYGATGALASFRRLGELYPPVSLASGHFLTYAYWPTNVEEGASPRELPDTIEWACSLDLFATDGTFLGSSVWLDTVEPEFGWPITVDADGKLYTVANEPYPQIRRYSVNILR